MTLTRRQFGAGVLVLAADAAPGAAKSPQADLPTAPRDRVAVASYPFRRSIIAPNNSDRDSSRPGMDLAPFAGFIKTEFHVNGIEPLDSHFPSKERGEVVKLRAAFDAAGVRTVKIPFDESVDLCCDDGAGRNAGNASYRQWIDIAVIWGSPSIHIWIPKCSDLRLRESSEIVAADHRLRGHAERRCESRKR
jgi:hypothetical protein